MGRRAAQGAPQTPIDEYLRFDFFSVRSVVLCGGSYFSGAPPRGVDVDEIVASFRVLRREFSAIAARSYGKQGPLSERIRDGFVAAFSLIWLGLWRCFAF
jgi:hypothetical protein